MTDIYYMAQPIKYKKSLSQEIILLGILEKIGIPGSFSYRRAVEAGIEYACRELAREYQHEVEMLLRISKIREGVR